MEEHELYGVPREQFIAERTALVKALRADGRREEAATVAALRKPSVVAWTVNQLVRGEPDRFAELLKAGDGLRAAQDRMLSGDGTAGELRDAVERERAAVDALLSVATHQGMSGAVSDRVAGSLHAAALDPDARREVCSGQLVEERRHVGFGDGSPVAGPAPSPPKPKRSNKDAAAARADARRAAEGERAEQRKLAEERTQVRHAERDARRRRQAAERSLANAEERHAKARAALQDAEDKLEVARADAQAASAEHDATQRALDSL